MENRLGRGRQDFLGRFMSDLYDTSLLEAIAGQVAFTNNFLLGKISDDLDSTYTDMFEVVRYGNDLIISRVDETSGQILSAVENAALGIGAVRIKIDNLTTYVEHTLFPVVSSIETTVKSNAAQLALISEKVDEIPEKTAALISSEINAGMDKVSEELKIMRMVLETLIIDQTARLEAAIISSAEIVSNELRTLGLGIKTELSAFKDSITTAVKSGFDSQTEEIKNLRISLADELRRMSENETAYQEAIILYVTQYWTQFETVNRKLRQMDYDVFAEGRSEGELLTSRIPDRPVDFPAIAQRDTNDYLEQYERERFAATGEQVT